MRKKGEAALFIQGWYYLAREFSKERHPFLSTTPTQGSSHEVLTVVQNFKCFSLFWQDTTRCMAASGLDVKHPPKVHVSKAWSLASDATRG